MWRLGPCQIVYANRVIYGEYRFLFTWGPGSNLSLTSGGGAEDWVAKVSHVGAPGLCDWPPLWTPRVRWPPLVGSALYLLSHIVAGRIKHCYVPPLGDDSWKFAPGFSWTLSYLPFTFTDYHLKLILRICGNSPPAHNFISMRSEIILIFMYVFCPECCRSFIYICWLN